LQAYSETSGIITMFYVVRGLSPYTEYEFHVIGVNNIGRGPASAAVSTTTGETGSKRKLNFKLLRNNSDKLKLNFVRERSRGKQWKKDNSLI
jgi:hypothetical protein